VGTGPEIGLLGSGPTRERNWLPLAIAAGIVVLSAAILIVILEHGRKQTTFAPVSSAPDPYAVSLPISGLVMSESGNLAGGKVTYVDGHILNTGNRTVSGIMVQVLFRDSAREVTQNETQPLKLIRTREPYVDVEPISAAPLRPGDARDFRLIFDAVSPDWDGAYPEIRILRVDSK
jgi:Protein of unknown function (DUF2393)